MAIAVNLDVIVPGELSQEVDVTSTLKNNKARAVRFTTLEAIFKVLNCRPGDIPEFVSDQE